MQSEMMDDARPLSLPANDRVVSTARRIEGRLGRALRPSTSERLGRRTSKRGTMATPSKVVGSEDPFRNLSDDILVDILARVPLFSFKAVKKVCKRWALVISTPEFDILRKELNPKPFLICYEISNWDPNKLQCFAYDVENNAWVILPGVQLPAPQSRFSQLPSSYQYGHLRAASEVVFFAPECNEYRLVYKLKSSASSAKSFGETWCETPIMMFPRSEPMVSVALGVGKGHKVVVAGGSDRDRARHMAVEVFDSEAVSMTIASTWEYFGVLPRVFKGNDSHGLMSGVVCDNKFYVSRIYQQVFEAYMNEVHIYFLDLCTKQWACMAIQLKSSKGFYSSHIMAIGTTLVLVGVCNPKQHAVKLWKVDLTTLSLIQIGLMPSKLSALLNQDNQDLYPLTFLYDENLVYFSICGELIFAEVSLEECKTYWRHLPTVPVQLFEHFLASIKVEAAKSVILS